MRKLDLRNNPITDVKGYRMFVLRRLKDLNNLDGVTIETEEMEKAMETSSVLTSTVIRDNSFTSPQFHASLTKPKSIRETSTSNSTKEGKDWWKQVVVLELDHHRARKIQNLDRLVNLKRLSLADNEISKIEGLSSCQHLEELVLEENNIKKIEGLSTLKKLKRLDLGKNRLQSVVGIETLMNLTQLSLENNDIYTLTGLEKLGNLMELYIGNNNLYSQKEILKLKPLEKLIILDLVGNSMTEETNYRGYCIFHLESLKVLDGMSIGQKELANATTLFFGKMSLDLLAERIGHSSFDIVEELDLTSTQLRELPDSMSTEFTSLRELILTNNNLGNGNMQCINGLKNLVVLRLNGNSMSNFGDLDNGETLALSIPSLEVLHLANNAITDITALHLDSLFNLKVLHLQENSIQRVTGLEGLLQLRELVLDNNRIRTIESYSFTDLDSLQELHIEKNGLRSLENFSCLRNLVYLFAGGNRITDLSDLEHVQLESIEDLVLVGNPVARKQLYRATCVMQFPTLRELDGRTVDQEERTKAELMLTPDIPPNIQLDTRPPAGKVALKMATMTFDPRYDGMNSGRSVASSSSSSGSSRTSKSTGRRR
eukprot:TRINITY_DN2746_c0_g2_i1.p1 TRINITY_DN2746_c0_g2~~TRINITY_DN2746_c0_g2_i1.p1  ORF type:complete len:600 (-),score=242.08 TRINITY_DN2746_c0_g2_i1:1232-3031(-)